MWAICLTGIKLNTGAVKCSFPSDTSDRIPSAPSMALCHYSFPSDTSDVIPSLHSAWLSVPALSMALCHYSFPSDTSDGIPSALSMALWQIALLIRSNAKAWSTKVISGISSHAIAVQFIHQSVTDFTITDTKISGILLHWYVPYGEASIIKFFLVLSCMHYNLSYQPVSDFKTGTHSLRHREVRCMIICRNKFRLFIWCFMEM